MKIAVLPNSIPLPKGNFDARISLFESASSATNGSVGRGILQSFNRSATRSAPIHAWDLVALAVAVIAADRHCNRLATSEDGWTRVIDLTVSVSDPSLWEGLKPLIERMLRFLSGDVWSTCFVPSEFQPTPPRNRVTSRSESCVSLLSGGLDSLIGAIDLSAKGENPLFVSNRVRGDCRRQSDFAKAVAIQGHLVALNHNAKTDTPNPEISQRPRSLAFIAFGVLAATVLDRYSQGETVDLYVPENGFIGLNVPLTRLRAGSLSTRTTHPIFMRDMQGLLDSLGLRIRLMNPYRLKTKGEMMMDCADQNLLARLAPDSMSCGRSGRSYQHCGRCLPCLVRRAAFLYWNGKVSGDGTTPVYRYPSSANGFTGEDFQQDDVMQCLEAIDIVTRQSARTWIGPAITESRIPGSESYREVAVRGLLEIQSFFKAVGVL